MLFTQIISFWIKKTHKKHNESIPLLYMRTASVVHTKSKKLKDIKSLYKKHPEFNWHDHQNKAKKAHKLQKNKTKTRKFLLTIILLILIATPFILRTPLTGLVIGVDESEFTKIVDINFNESGTYTLTPQELGELTSLSISGKLSKYGKIKITVENKTILDTEEIRETINLTTASKIFGALTGQAIDEEEKEEEKEENKEKTPKEKFEDEPIKKEETEEEEEEEVEDEEEKETKEEEIQEEATTEETTQEEVEPQESETQEIEEVSNETSQEKTTSPPSFENETIQTEENETIQSEENKTETQEKEEVSKETSQEKTTSPPSFENESIMIEFENYCLETCALTNLKKNSYEIKIEIENASLKLESIQYRIKNPKINETANLTLGQINSEELIQEPAELNKPVKWKKTILTNDTKTIQINLPIESKNIEVQKIKDNEKEIPEFTIEKKTKKEIQESLLKRIALTGNVIEEDKTEEEELIISIKDAAEKYEIYYETSPPQKTEKEISDIAKEITIYSSTELNYSNILAFTNLTNETEKEKIKLYHTTTGSRIKTNFTAYDTNNNSLIDYIEWIVPHLSNQTYEVELQLYKERILGNITQDFFIQRGYSIIPAGQTTLTLQAGTDYISPTGEAFIRITNTRLSGMGKTSGGGNQNADDFMVFISNPSNIKSNIIFQRNGNANDNRIAWEIIEYIGPEGGSNAFKVRDANTHSLTFELANAASSVPSVINNNNVVIFITGQSTSDTGRGDVNTGMHTASWNPITKQPEFTRGEVSGDTSTLSYAVVEFTGNNWKIQRIEHQYTFAGVVETETISTINSINKAFLHTQHRSGSGMQGLDEQGEQAYISSPSEISFQLISGAGTTNQVTVAWLIENTQSSGIPMNVQHISGTRPNGGNEEDTWTDTITEVKSLNQTSIIGENTDSTGAGTAFPRGFNTLYLLDKTTVEHKRSDTGQTQNYRYSVVEWPTEITKGAPNITLTYPPTKSIHKIEPNFTFKATDERISTLFCGLIFLNNSEIVYTFNATVKNNTETTFETENLSSGIYNWQINCTNGEIMSTSDTREIAIIKNLTVNLTQNTQGDLECSYSKIPGIDYSINWIENNESMEKLNIDFNTNPSIDISKTNNITGNAKLQNYARGFSGAYYFNGSTFLEISQDISQWLGYESTMSFWIKTNQTGSDTNWLAPGITGIEEAGGVNDIFWGIIDSTGRLGAASGDTTMVKTLAPINDNTWKHITITRNDTNGEIAIYQNGFLEQKANSQIGQITNPFTKIGVIEDTGGTPEYFIGYIDDLIIFNRILSEEQIQMFSNNEIEYLHKKDAIIGNNYSCSVNFYFGNETLGEITSPKLELSQNEHPTTPSSITCDGSMCNGSYIDSINLQCSGSTDKEGNTITYEILSTHKSEQIYSTIGYYREILGTSPNYNPKTCSEEWGFDCSTGPPESQDNTIDSCEPGQGNDESVNQIYLNSSSVKPGETILTTCEFDPYTSGDDTFIWFNNGSVWSKVYEHLNWGASVLTNESVIITAPTTPGTYHIRCGIVYDTDATNDNCANAGSWYDNDDISFNVISQSNIQDENLSENTFIQIGGDITEMNELTIAVNIESYNPESSIENNNNKPDLLLSVWNGAQYISYGQLNISSHYPLNTIQTEKKTISVKVKDNTTINAWKTRAHQNIKLQPIYFDSTNSKTDSINYSSIEINLVNKNSTYLGEHLENEMLTWNISALTNSVDELSCRAIDKNASTNYSEYFTMDVNIIKDDDGITASEITVYKDLMSDVSTGLNEGPLPTDIAIKFQAFNNRGYTKLQDGTAAIEFSKSGEETRSSSCSRITSESSGKYANYTCNVQMQFWDGPGIWRIKASISDDRGVLYEDSSKTFTVGATSGFLISNSNLTWGELNPGDINTESLNPIVLQNTGNTIKNIKIYSTDLLGESDNSKILSANNFSISNSIGCNGTLMQKNTEIIIQNSQLKKGNYILNTGEGEEQLFFCIKEIPQDIISQTYSTSQTGAWIIKIFSTLITIKRRKIKELLEKLNEFGITENDILNTIIEKEEEIPLEIFKKELGALEAIVKYMKENLQMNFSEISKKLNRDPRTIWSSYNKSKEKSPKEFIIHSKDYISIDIFEKELTILESLIYHLRNNGLKYSEIGKILNRNEKNIWTINSRINKKIK